MQNELNLEFNETLSIYESLISYQKDEILKTESIISKFENNILKQNEALKIFLDERQKLMDNSNRIVKVAERCGHTFRVTHWNNDLNDQFIKVTEAALPRHLKIFMKTMIESEKEILTLYVWKEHIIIGGSEGLLMRVTGSKIFTYETNLTENIEKIEVIFTSKRISLIAFTKDTILIYENIDDLTLHSRIKQLGMGYIYSDDNFLYIPLKSGKMRRITKDSLIFDADIDFMMGEVCSLVYVNYFKMKRLSLVSFGGTLYKVKVGYKQLYNIDCVEGFRDIRKIVKVMESLLFYSDYSMWFMDEDINEIGNINFENKIKFVEVFLNILIVLDHGSMLHIYRFKENGHLERKICANKIMENITALCVSEDKVYVSVGNEIFIIEYK